MTQKLTDQEQFANRLTAGSVAAELVDRIMTEENDQEENPIRLTGQYTDDNPCPRHEGFRLLMQAVPDLRRGLMSLPYRNLEASWTNLEEQVRAAADEAMSTMPPDTRAKIAAAIPEIRAQLR